MDTTELSLLDQLENKISTLKKDADSYKEDAKILKLSLTELTERVEALSTEKNHLEDETLRLLEIEIKYQELLKKESLISERIRNMLTLMET